MPEYNAITVIFFRIKDGKYYFYLTKKGPNLPIMPSSWTPVGSIITKEDKELHSALQSQYGDMAPDMLKRLTALRVVFERNFFHTEKIAELDLKSNVHEIINAIDPELLSLWLHSMIPSGFQRFQSGDNIFNTDYYLFIAPSNPKLKDMKLKRGSMVFESRNIIVEEKAKWFEAGQISKEYHNMKKFFTTSMSILAEKITKEFKKPFEAARELDQKIGVSPCRDYQIFPYTWKLSTPAPTLPPYNTTNIYVIGNEHKYIIDPGSTEIKALDPLTQFIEYNKETMEGILLTNPYPDHCNQAQYLSKTFNIPMSTSRYIANDLEKEGFVFTSILEEGDKILLGSNPELNIENWNLEVMQLPGSSKGSIGFWDQRGLLFSGITLHNDLTTTNDTYPESYTEFMASLKKIKKLKARYALSGHGNIITRVNYTIKQNIHHLKELEKRILFHLKQGISELEAITDKVISTRTRSWRFYMKRIVASILEKLVNEEKITKIGSEYIFRKTSTSWK
jgi:glyoxylase-like metal-dependent hydrolase (beta-lactamase superfamily II)